MYVPFATPSLPEESRWLFACLGERTQKQLLLLVSVLVLLVLLVQLLVLLLVLLAVLVLALLLLRLVLVLVLVLVLEVPLLASGHSWGRTRRCSTRTAWAWRRGP